MFLPVYINLKDKGEETPILLEKFESWMEN